MDCCAFFLIEHIGEGVVSPKNPYMEPMCFENKRIGCESMVKVWLIPISVA